ncbi:3-oxoacyl-ACP synthase [Paucibacter sp. XJ19-41]|uniref:3-oxoacyl-ACP synthase n=1 Tax=Paucibacter sp. XJ19-41 TaxID=2927824 RepID=UPI00234A4A91|nr:3-oxoacyl-ACP synthase [Paucibacter sp. XJ19-41]MDC6167150.1 3-oxoacyl-ACP synthase [Paucibacter sp. XJ19-41]
MAQTEPVLGIRSAAYHLPPRSFDIGEWAQRHGLARDRVEALRVNGVGRYHDSCDRPTREMALDAAAAAFGKAELDAAEVDVLMFAHTAVESVVPPPASLTSFLQSRLGMSKARCFSVAQQNCVSPIVAVRLAETMMRADASVRHVLVVASDQIRSGIDHLRVIELGGMHSDGACAMVLTRDWERNRVLATTNSTEARYYLGSLEAMEFIEGYYLSTAATLRRAVHDAGLEMSDIGAILPHHVGLTAWQKVMRFLRLPPERLHTDGFASKGHVFGCDAIIDFSEWKGGEDRPLVLYSNGLCGCYGAMVVAP